VLALPALVVGLGASELEMRRFAAEREAAAALRLEGAARTLEETAARARAGADALCAEPPDVGLSQVSPSAALDVDRARGRVHRMRAHGLDVVDVLAAARFGSDEGAEALLASSHARGRQPFVAMPNREALSRGAVVALSSPHDGLPAHAVVHACEAEGGLLVIAGVALDLARDPRLAGVSIDDGQAAQIGPALGTELAGARRITATVSAPGAGLARPAVLGACALLFVLGLVLGPMLGPMLGPVLGPVLAAARGATPRRTEEEEPGLAREVQQAAAKLSRGDFDVQLNAGGQATVSAFNEMTKELSRARARAVKAERIAAWRDIARRIAHEIKNPLTPIKMAIETMRKTFARQHPDFPEIFEESTRTVLEEVERMEKIVTEFSRFARLPRPNASRIDVLEVCVHVVSMHEVQNVAATNPETPRAARVKLEVDPAWKTEGGPRLVRADREQITQVLVNLVQNAIDAAVSKRGIEGANVLVRVSPGERGGAVIEVHDDGPGLPPEERARVFEPYYTTKAHGTGLGLPICDRIVSDHGGTLTVDESPRLGGARFVVTLSREGPLDEADASQTV
jgi:signal transduction histidine kinase